MSKCFLVTFRPLIQTAAGRIAARQHSLPPFIDGSCRREPDFESPYPSITATCRAGKFVPRLQVGHRVAYLTVKSKFDGDLAAGWRLVAVLSIIRRFGNHEEAARWYRLNRHPLPSNCLVPDNPPKPFELTNGNPPNEVKERLGEAPDFHAAITLWNATYRRRVSKWPVFLATTPEFLELKRPPQLLEPQIVEIFGKVPGTQNPRQITCEQLQRLLDLGRNAQRNQ